MFHRPRARVIHGHARRTPGPAVARARRLDLEHDRPRRIDQYIDYFGGGCERRWSLGWTQNPIGNGHDVA
jgi:hypothetical protein